MASIGYYFGERTADAHARTVARQGLMRASARLTGINGVAVTQNEIVVHALTAQLPAPDFHALMGGLAPAFVARPTLTFVGVALASNGEYAMLERIGSGAARLRHYVERPDGQHEIRNYEPDAVGHLALATVVPWDGYDPRTRPFYRDALAAGRPVWTESYIFRGNERRPAALGVTFAAPVRDAAGRVVAVVDTDFDTRALSAFMAELQRELPGRIFVMERRHDGSFRVVAHSSYDKSTAFTEADLAREPAAALVAREISRPDGAKARELIEFELEGEDYVGSFDLLHGENMPP